MSITKFVLLCLSVFCLPVVVIVLLPVIDKYTVFPLFIGVDLLRFAVIKRLCKAPA